MFYLGLEGEWTHKMVRVPSYPGVNVAACYQTVQETATADCFYYGDSESTSEHHVALDPRDVTV